MNNLLLTTLIIAGLVLFIYQQKPSAKPTNTKATQTEFQSSENNKELEEVLDKLIQNIRKLNSEI